MIVSTAFVLLAAWSVLRRIRTGSDSGDLLVFLLLFTAIQSLLIVFAGFFGFLSPWPLTAICTAGLGILWGAGERPDFRTWKWTGSPAPADRAIRIGLTVAALLLLIKAVLLDPYWGDAIHYHLPTVAEWVQAGEFTHGWLADPRIWLPAGFQLVETWWVVFPRHDLLVELGGLQMLAIALVAVNVLARSLRIRANLAVFIFAYLPLAVLHVTACGNDLAVGAMVLSSYALVRIRAPRALQIFPLLLGAGMKPTMLFAAVGVVLYALMADRPVSRLPRPWAAALVGAGLLLGGYWFARNTIVTGHPTRAAMVVEESSVRLHSGKFSIDELWHSIREFPGYVEDRREFQALAPLSTSWGWFILAIGIPGTLLAIRADPDFRRLAIAFIAGLFVLFAGVNADGQALRFAVWFPALFVLGGARLPGRSILVAAFLAAALNLVATVVPYETIAYREFMRDLPEDLPRDAPMAFVTTFDAPSYPFYNSDFSRKVTYPRSMQEVVDSGVRYVYLVSVPKWAEPLRRKDRYLGMRIYEVP